MGEKANNAGTALSGRESLRKASRFRLQIEGWKLTAIEITAVVAFAGLLARFFFY
jgi:hypothetical protein